MLPSSANRYAHITHDVCSYSCSLNSGCESIKLIWKKPDDEEKRKRNPRMAKKRTWIRITFRNGSTNMLNINLTYLIEQVSGACGACWWCCALFLTALICGGALSCPPPCHLSSCNGVGCLLTLYDLWHLFVCELLNYAQMSVVYVHTCSTNCIITRMIRI